MVLFDIIINLVGGLGLFLFGIKLMGEGLANLAGNKIKTLFEKIASSSPKGVLTGIIITAIIQSSSATTVMVVGFVNAGLINLYQATAVIMGANIGTTITGQIISLNFEKVIPAFIGVGTVMIISFKKDKIKEIGSIFLGFGILFLGMEFMKEIMVPLARSEILGNIIISLKGNIFLGIFLGIIMTAAIQSSSASTGILIVLSESGILPIEVAIPVIFGNNIGTCVTALIASVGTLKNAKRAAIIHLLFNLIGTMIFIPLLPLLKYIVVQTNSQDITRQIANTHTIFNIANVLIMMPFISYLISLVEGLIPGEDEYEDIRIKFIDERILETPIIGVGQALQEIFRMGRKAKENLVIAVEAFKTSNEEEARRVYDNEKLINLLEKEITTFLVKLSNTDLSEEQKNKVINMFYAVNDIERIGDHCKNIADLALERMHNRVSISEKAIEEINNVYNYTLDALSNSIISFRENSANKAEITLVLEQNIDRLEEQYRISHINRLNNGMCDAYSGAIFLGIISNLERIADHANNIAEYVIKQV
ncbi:sodium-dependent phosphate transporter [Clostridium bovifaecis]|uniref:Sodium-dependent phosphate transporter n=1 Tax=Clostridium bovifaecis TaxID=2184719 RepID=A0A6I6EVZ0_9CLOT|nr:sodium-dependent phosphate transporter [Clostridium bovifaecis]